MRESSSGIDSTEADYEYDHSTEGQDGHVLKGKEEVDENDYRHVALHGGEPIAVCRYVSQRLQPPVVFDGTLDFKASVQQEAYTYVRQDQNESFWMYIESAIWRLTN
jgi:hypothetical protein